MNGHLSDNQLSDYVDGEMSDADRGSVEAHLAACAICAADLAHLRALLGELRSLPADRQAAQELRSRVRRTVRRRRYARPALLAAGLAAIALGTLWVNDRSESSAYEHDPATAAALLIIDRAIQDLQHEVKQRPDNALVHEMLDHAQRRRAEVAADALALRGQS